MKNSGLPATRDTPALTRAYLDLIAETIQSVMMPSLDSGAKSAAGECLRVLSRLSAQLDDDGGMAATPSAEADAFRRFNVRAQSLQQRIRASGTAAKRPFDPAPVERFLRQHARGGPETRIVEHKMLAGGRSKVTVLLAQQGARDLPDEMILRQDWSASVVGSTVLGEFALLERLYEKGIKVPQPLAQFTEKSADANPYIVVARSSGSTYGGDHHALPPIEAPILAMAEQLGRIHALEPGQFIGIPGIEERNYTPAQLQATLATYRSVVEQFGDPPSAIVHEVLSWLERHVATAAAGPRSLVHGDIGFHNSLCLDAELSVILDWELAHVGSAAYDLGYLRNAIVDDAQWTRFMAAYRAAGGPDVSAFHVDYFHLLACLWFYQLVLQARAALQAGMLHDIAVAAACADIMPVSMEVMAAALERAIHRHGD